MSYFAVTSEQQVIEALNYALSNLAGQGLQADVATGQITAAGDPAVVGYLYPFVNIRYADNSTGTLNFSTSPTNRFYYGVRNTTSSAGSSNPNDYVWFTVTGGFGTNKFLFFSTTGGRTIIFTVATTAPTADYQQTGDSTAIDLDVLTTTGAPGATGPEGPSGPLGPSVVPLAHRVLVVLVAHRVLVVQLALLEMMEQLALLEMMEQPGHKAQQVLQEPAVVVQWRWHLCWFQAIPQWHPVPH